ncbi:wd40 repeat protein [Anaeramoeba flamelloides]|uniref:Wd40 repeat protein n=1 Tax=Anaeramoeba flamelloides TaxID=1746091 RepID=A0ABQ8Z5Y0_9EUKA|nr:wd40 repeat protein [Anaeramoeba flamelloides]
MNYEVLKNTRGSIPYCDPLVIYGEYGGPSVNCLSMDETYLYCGLQNQEIKVYDINSAHLIKTYLNHSAPLSGLKVANGVLYASDTGGFLRSYDIKNENLLTTFEGHSGKITTFFINETGKLFSGSSDNTIKLWNTLDGSVVQNYEEHNDMITMLYLQNEHLITSSVDKTLKLWDVESGQVIHTFKGHNGWVLCFKVDTTNRLIYSGSHDSKIKAWDPRTAKCVHTFKGHKFAISRLLIEGNRLFSSSWDGRIGMWNLKNKKRGANFLNGHRGQIRGMILSTDQSRIYSYANDHEIRIWDIKKRITKAIFRGHKNTIYSVKFDQNGRLFSGSKDGTINRWPASRKQRSKSILKEMSYIKEYNSNLFLKGIKSMFLIYVNGEPKRVSPELTLFEACKEFGITIPTLCHHPRLSPIGICGLCAVEINNQYGEKEIVNSCSYQVRENIEVWTNTMNVKKKVQKSLRIIKKKLLDRQLNANSNNETNFFGNHDLGGQNNELFKFCIEELNKTNSLVESTNAINLDLSKCIDCGRCVQVCTELMGVDVFQMKLKNIKKFNCSLSTTNNLSLMKSNCIDCGQCTSFCPTNALTEKFVNLNLLKKKLLDPNVHVVIGISPEVYVSFAEMLEIEPQVISKKKIVGVLNKLGFENVFSLDFAINVLILQEAKLLQAKIQQMGDHKNNYNNYEINNNDDDDDDDVDHNDYDAEGDDDDNDNNNNDNNNTNNYNDHESKKKKNKKKKTKLRVKKKKKTRAKPKNKPNHNGYLPLISSVCPSLIKMVKKMFPNLIPYLSLHKTPSQIFGLLIKSYYAERLKLNPNNVFTIILTGCVSVKNEIKTPQNKNIKGFNNIDMCLTIRELGNIIKQNKNKFKNLEEITKKKFTTIFPDYEPQNNSDFVIQRGGFATLVVDCLNQLDQKKSELKNQNITRKKRIDSLAEYLEWKKLKATKIKNKENKMFSRRKKKKSLKRTQRKKYIINDWEYVEKTDLSPFYFQLDLNETQVNDDESDSDNIKENDIGTGLGKENKTEMENKTEKENMVEKENKMGKEKAPKRETGEEIEGEKEKEKGNGDENGKEDEKEKEKEKERKKKNNSILKTKKNTLRIKTNINNKTNHVLTNSDKTNDNNKSGIPNTNYSTTNRIKKKNKSIFTLSDERKKIDKVDFQKLKSQKQIQLGKVQINGKDIKIIVVDGGNSVKYFSKLFESLGPSYHYIEIRACPFSCIGGGGHPKSKDKIIPTRETIFQTLNPRLQPLDYSLFEDTYMETVSHNIQLKNRIEHYQPIKKKNENFKSGTLNANRSLNTNSNTKNQILKKEKIKNFDKNLHSKNSILILYGSQTGIAREISYKIYEQWHSFKLKARIFALDEIELEDLKSEEIVIFVVSTYWEGSFPDNAQFFWKKIKSLQINLSNLRYTIYGVGNSNYTKFNHAAINLDDRLNQLGAIRILPILKSDSQNYNGYLKDFDHFMNSLKKASRK